MVNGVIHSNIPTNLFGLTRDFSEAESTKFIRGQEGSKILHTTSTVGGAIAGFFAKLGIGKSTQESERQAGVNTIKNMIASEFREPGLADKIFSEIKEQTGRDLNKGVTVGDLNMLREYAKEMNAGNNKYVPLKESDDDFVYRPGGQENNVKAVKIELPKDDILLDIEINKLNLEVESLLNKPEDTSSDEIVEQRNDLYMRVLERKVNEAKQSMEEIKDDFELDGDAQELLKYVEERTDLNADVNISTDDLLKMIGEVQEERADKIDTIETLAHIVYDVHFGSDKVNTPVNGLPTENGTIKSEPSKYIPLVEIDQN